MELAAKKWVTIGETVIDRWSHFVSVGGAPANFAAVAAGFGHDSILVSAVGSDEAGKLVLKQVAERGISAAYIQVNPRQPTGIFQIERKSNQGVDFRCSGLAAFDTLAYRPELDSLALEACVLYFTAVGQRDHRAQQTILEFASRANQAVKLFDVNVRTPTQRHLETIQSAVAHADAVKVNRKELELLERIFCRARGSMRDRVVALSRRLGKAMLIVTLGADGSLVVDPVNKIVVYAPGFSVPIKDCLGAGDAFCAAFLHSWLENGGSLDVALRFANAAGAIACTRQSAFGPIVEARMVELMNRGELRTAQKIQETADILAEETLRSRCEARAGNFGKSARKS